MIARLLPITPRQALVGALMFVPAIAEAAAPGINTERAAASSTDAIAAPVVSPEARYISLVALHRRLQAGERIHLVDLCDQASFERFHLPGAVRLTPLQLRAMGAWRPEPIVLLGSGAAYVALESVAKQLHRDGFPDVQILDGGTAAWQRHVLRNANGADLAIAPDRLDLPGDAARWVILDLDSEVTSSTNFRVQALEADDLRQSLPKLRVAVERAAETIDGRVMNLLVVGRSAERAADYATQISRRLDINVFALKGTWRDWESTAAMRRSITASRGDGMPATLGGQCW